MFLHRPELLGSFGGAGLTSAPRAPNLINMHLAKPIFLAVLAVTFAAFAFDCDAAATPAQAMECCASMPCAPHGHQNGQDCCKTMPEMRTPFVQPAPVHGVSYFPFVVTVLPAAGKPLGLDTANPLISTQCHAPPSLSQPASRPLRI